MAINFPATPTLNQTYTFNGRTWTYNGVGWQATGASGLSVYTKTDFTATAAQTTFSVTYTVGFVDVYYNGSKLSITEYTATNGTSVVLGTACAVNDIVETVAWTVSTTLNPALGVATATSLAIGGATIGSNALAVTGTTALSGLLTAAGGVSSTLTTDASSSTTGSIITAGGISTQKALFVGTTTTLAGALTYGGVTLSNAVTGTGKMVLDTAPTLTLPNATGLSLTTGVTGVLPVANGGTGTSIQPAFSAYASVSQSISSETYTKVTLGTEHFDTNSNFASSRFTATVAGYYQFNGTIRFADSVSILVSIIMFYKNGVNYTFLGQNNTSSGTNQTVSGGAIIYLGVSDYVEMYGYISGTSPLFEYGGVNYATSNMNGSFLHT